MNMDELLKKWTSRLFMEMGTEVFAKHYKKIEEALIDAFNAGLSEKESMK